MLSPQSFCADVGIPIQENAISFIEPFMTFAHSICLVEIRPVGYSSCLEYDEETTGRNSTRQMEWPKVMKDSVKGMTSLDWPVLCPRSGSGGVLI